MRNLVFILTIAFSLSSYGLPQAVASEPKILNSKQVTITGKAETHREIGMWWIRLYTGQGKPVSIGALSNFSDVTRNCLENAAETQQPVTVKGTLVTYAGGSSGMDENTVQCAPAAQSATAKTLKLTEAQHNKFSM